MFNNVNLVSLRMYDDDQVVLPKYLLLNVSSQSVLQSNLVTMPPVGTEQEWRSNEGL